MIKQFRVQNYKCLHDVTLDLTPIHVLIGLNDSGKTSILEAIAALCRSVNHMLPDAFIGPWEGRDLVWRRESALQVGFVSSLEVDKTRAEYRLHCKFPAEGRSASFEREQITTGTTIDFGPNGHRTSRVNSTVRAGDTGPIDHRGPAKTVADALGGVHFYRWNPSFLALPVAPDAKRRFRMEPSGFGLALCLDDILGYDRDQFIRLENRFREIFPHIKSIKLMPEPAYRAPVDDPKQIPMLDRADGKGIHFEFAGGGELVPASQASDGLLLVLAYLTVLCLPKPPRVILVEEPENGIHPKRLQDVLKILRELVKEQTHTQVILTTHSPYVVDLFKPEEVTLCQMEDDGSVSVRRLSESKTVREQLKVFTLGEIWTAEGDEALARSTAPDKETGE